MGDGGREALDAHRTYRATGAADDGEGGAGREHSRQMSGTRDLVDAAECC